MTDTTLTRAIIGNNAMRASFLDAGRLNGTQLLQRARMWVHRCATVNADACASVPFKLFAKGGPKDMGKFGYGRALNSREKAFVRGGMDVVPACTLKGMLYDVDNLSVVERHPLLDLLQDVNEWSNGFEFRQGIYYDLDVFGMSFAHLTMGGNRPTGMWRLPPFLVEVLPGREEFVRGFEFGQTADKVTYEPDEVLWFKLFDPQNPWGGFSPLQAWWKSVDTSMHIEDFRHDLMENHGSPDYVLTKANLNKEQKQDFRRSWRRVFSRWFNRSSNIAILDGEAELKRLSDTNKELDFVNTADQVRDTILAAFGTPKSFVTSDDVNRANAREGTNVWMRTTLWPKIQRVEDVLNEQLVERWGGTLMLVHDNPIREDETIRITDRKSKLESGWTINEVRAEDGEEGIGPDGDQPLVGQGLKTLESVINPPDPPAMVGENPNPTEDNADDDSRDDATDDGVDGADSDADADSAAGDSAGGKKSLDAPDAVDERRPDEDAITLAGKAIDALTRLIEKDRKPGEPVPDMLTGKPDALAVRSIQAGIVDYINTVISRVKNQRGETMSGVGIDVLAPFDELEELENRMSRDVRDHIARAFEEKAEQAYREVAALEEAGDVGISFGLENRRAQQYVAEHTRRISVYAAETLSKDMREEIIGALDTGIAPRELAKTLHEKFIEGAKYRAERVARTELAFAHVAGSIEGWRSSGVVVGKQWVLAPEACPICEAAAAKYGPGTGAVSESTTLGLNDPFFRVGDALQYEGPDGEMKSFEFTYADMQGPPIHPNCLLPETPVGAVGVVAGFRAWYDGPAVRITTAEGRTLAVTGNHKLLTPDGFASADTLDVGDELIGAEWREGVFERYPNDHEGHIAVEDVVASLSVSSGVSPVSVPVSAEHFHGDGRLMDGDVHVVRPDGELWRRFETALIEHPRETPLCAVGQSDSLTGLSDLHSMICGMSLAAHGIMGSAREFLPLVGSQSSHSDLVGFGPATDSDTALLQSPAKGVTAYTEILAQCEQALPGAVSTDKIVHIERLHWCGHVYDLQTFSGLYSANGILSGNCRCSLRPVLDDD